MHCEAFQAADAIFIVPSFWAESCGRRKAKSGESLSQQTRESSSVHKKNFHQWCYCVYLSWLWRPHFCCSSKFPKGIVLYICNCPLLLFLFLFLFFQVVGMWSIKSNNLATLLIGFSPSIAIGVLNLVIPLIFEALAQYEGYCSPATVMNMTLIRYISNITRFFDGLCKRLKRDTIYRDKSRRHFSF